MDRISIISVERESREEIELKVNLRDNISVYPGDGEQYKNISGDIIIYTNTIKDDVFEYKNYDLYRTIEIKLYEYLYGGTIFIEHLDGSPIAIRHNGFIHREPLIVEKNKGLLIDSSNRGSLILKIKIKNSETEQFKMKILNLE